MSNAIRTKAIVLSRINYGEADRIMQFITPSEGKVSAIARGVRREKSKLAGGVELLAVSDVTLHQGKGELMVVTSARLETFFSHILEDYDRLQLAYYALKDVSKAAEQVTEPEFYDLTHGVLTGLNDLRVDARIVELWYRLQMAILLGVGANLATDQNGMKLVEDTTYRFDTDEMALIYDERGQYTTDHIKLLRVASAQPPQIAARVKGIDSLVDACLRIARAVHE